MRSSRIWGIIKAAVCVITLITQTEAFMIPHIPREPNSIIVLLFICKNFFQDRRTFSLRKTFVFYPFQQKLHKLAWRHIVLHCFQYTIKLRHNDVYLFSIFHGEVITPDLGNYQGYDDSIDSSKPVKPLKYFQ